MLTHTVKSMRLAKLLGVLLYLSVTVAVLTACGPVSTAAASPLDYWPTDGWQRSTPEAQGMDSQSLVAMYEAIAEQGINLHSLLVIRNGYIVSEAYFHPYAPDVPHDIASVTKSVTATLIGIAIQQGAINSIDDAVLSFYPGQSIYKRDALKEALTLKHLLTLQTGLECDLGVTEAEMQRSGNWSTYLLNLPMSYEPGTQWYYCSPATHLLSAVLQKSTGMTAREYANAALFEPLGIAPVAPEQWPADPQGITRGDIELDLTPRDVAKLGLLYLQDGVWDGSRLLPEGWVAEASARQADKGDGTSYGYLWTTYPHESRYSALGLGGQQLHIFPEHNIIVTTTAALPAYAESEEVNALLNDYILPAVQAEDPLPENADAAAELEALQQAAVEPVPAVAPAPDTARAISGRLYILDENPMGWRSLRFTFLEDEAAGQATLNEEIGFAVGMDGRYRITEIPGALPTALRARWVDEATLRIEQINVGSTEEYELTITFHGGDIVVHAVETVFNTVNVEIRGVAEE